MASVITLTGKNVPLAGAHCDAPLQEILNRLGNLSPENALKIVHGFTI
jgi:hypothetical protein